MINQEGMKQTHKFETHEAILKKISQLVDGNITPYEHGRESLDDIINDLIDFRNTLPSVDAYMQAGEL